MARPLGEPVNRASVIALSRILLRGGFVAFLISMAAMTVAPAVADPLFESDTVVEVRITGPFSSLLDSREKPERSWFPFQMDVEDTVLPVQIRIRGHSRVRVCEFPPLRLDFGDPGPDTTAFSGQEHVKLVTHCRHYDEGEQDLLQEYLAYRIFNLLTDTGFRVRLLRAHYEDTEKGLPAKASPRYAFLIEPAKKMASRLGAELAGVDAFPRYRHAREHAALVYVFQYLIANTDWSLVKADYDDECCHNIRLIRADSGLTMIPYDFDLAGLVNARYAFPDPKLRLGRVTRRRYRGVCTEPEFVLDAIRHVKSMKQEILALPATLPGLTAKDADRAVDFLEGFFEQAEKEEKLLKNFESRCL